MIFTCRYLESRNLLIEAQEIQRGWCIYRWKAIFNSTSTRMRGG